MDTAIAAYALEANFSAERHQGDFLGATAQSIPPEKIGEY
jgi:hypothetical protein